MHGFTVRGSSSAIFIFASILNRGGKHKVIIIIIIIIIMSLFNEEHTFGKTNLP